MVPSTILSRPPILPLHRHCSRMNHNVSTSCSDEYNAFVENDALILSLRALDTNIVMALTVISVTSAT